MNTNKRITMPSIQSTDQDAVRRITALWALAESGLGGVMFALKIPFTGFIIGAIALVLLSLVAQFSHNNYRQIIGATVIVLIVKATVSPHSPPPAYFAVGFQGLMAALLFSTVRSHKTACIFLGMLSMAESSLQKVIVLTLIFGKKIWEAFNGLADELMKQFHFHMKGNAAWWLIGIHLVLYITWGAVVGRWAAKVPSEISRRKAGTLEQFAATSAAAALPVSTQRRRRGLKRLLIYASILAFIILVFVLSGANGKQVSWIFFRSIAAILLLFYVLQPVVKYFIDRWLRNRSAAQQQEAGEVISMLPGLRSYVAIAYKMTDERSNIFRRFRSFLLNMIILTLYAKP